MDPSAATSPGARRSFLFHCISMASAVVMLQAGCGGGGAEEGSPDGAGAMRKAEASSDHADGRQVGGKPLRLTPQGRRLLGPDGRPVLLHGANLRDNLTSSGKSKEIITPSEADDLAAGLSFNFVRLRISHERTNRDDGHESGLSLDARTTLNNAVELLRARRVWMLLEMRTDDDTANSRAFYTPGTAEFERYKKTWVWLAKTYGNTDYIAGYGLLAEPSPDKDKSVEDPVPLLIKFQSSLMQAISTLDTSTPFFVGPAYNYDTMGYRWDAYYTDAQLQPFQKRLVYEVNMLSPKSWVTSATAPDGSDAGPWPRPAADDFSVLLSIEPGEKYVRPRDDEQIFTKRSKEMDKFPLLMSSNYADWYLGFAAAFAEKHQVPMVLDQFGATTSVNTAQRPFQQLRYEYQVLETAERLGMGWSRWLYSNESTLDRSIAGNDAVHEFYRQIGLRRAGP